MSAPRQLAPCADGVPVRAVLFDLDGTLLDTVADIHLALNRALAEQGAAALPLEYVRTLIGRGAPSLVQRVVARLSPRPWPVDAVLLLQRFYFHYDDLHERHEHEARVYPGVAAGLERLHADGVRLGVVTNKPRHTATALLVQLGLSQWIDVVVGGDTAEQRKPHPQPLLHACEALQVLPAHALMVGDSSIDVQAARAAGMRIVCVPYGYNEGADPRALPCDALIDSVAELCGLLPAGTPPGPLTRGALMTPGQ
ncbi:MAG TPA: phosphoglycolate phosphatase [Steroidobacteraceae bacterium]|nr:phosphoglycolate phosphatase [Steroidobacteraceae bacterium]